MIDYMYEEIFCAYKYYTLIWKYFFKKILKYKST
jgi:hypothetical protein